MLIASKNEFDTNKRLIALFSFVSFFSLCLMPFIPIQKGFYIRPEDLLLPFILFIIYPYLKILKNWYFVILASWAIYGIITMALNGRLNAYNDYFELYKLFKFAVFILLFYIFFKVNKEVFKPVVIVFSILFIFNLLHFYNVFQFNELIMPSFATNSAQLDFFGKNSLGGPATKRILGTMGNPNINGILFSFFAIYFIRFLKLKNWHWGQLFFFLSITMILLTQSRTCMFALGVYLLYFVFIEKVGWWIFLKLLIGILISIVIVRMMDELSLGYISNAKFNVAENGSLRGRLEVWTELWAMIKEKPIIGYGINKNYFYAHQLYSENEYILMVWRYGAIGLFFYLAMLFSPLKFLKNWKDVKTEKSIFFILLLILFSINGLTNNPISDPVLQLLFGIGVAYYLSQFELHEKKIKNA
jgi:O-antigen ligase